MYLNVELELALVAILKCLVLLHDYLGPNTKKLWLNTLAHLIVFSVDKTVVLSPMSKFWIYDLPHNFYLI